jgi:uncharacterized membrane protein HdeD (DUF308 family)
MSEISATQEAPFVPWWLVLLQGIAAVILGFFLLTSPGATLLILIQFMGIYWFVGGIFSIVAIFIDSSAWGWKLFSGLLGIIAGIVVIQHPLWSAVLVPATVVIIIAIEGIIIGVVGLIQAFRGGGWGAGILGVISILFGIILFLNPVMGAAALPFVAGAFAIAGGIAAIVAAFRLRD